MLQESDNVIAPVPLVTRARADHDNVTRGAESVRDKLHMKREIFVWHELDSEHLF